MTVLVTRPGEQGEQLCALLSTHGISAIHHPLIHIHENVSNPVPSTFLNYDIIIAVSQHAVRFAQKKLLNHGLSWPSQALYFAVGQKTAQHLGKVVEQVVHYPQIGDSEHLLSLAELSDIEQKSILILRGNGGRELIKQQLELRDANVDYWETYQRNEVPFNPNYAISKWKRNGIKKVIVTSSEQLEALCRPLLPEQFIWLSQLELLVPSQRISQHAKQKGFKLVTCTGSASNHDLLTTLQLK